jgi:hypothetical protein
VKTAFSASQFVATKWDTAEDKARFANQFLNFVESDFSASKFPKWFYKRLSMTFGHIAHYDQAGFWSEFFQSSEGKVRFIEQTLRHLCWGDPTCTYSDVEHDLKSVLSVSGVLEKVRRDHSQAVESSERGELSRLKAKYE